MSKVMKGCTKEFRHKDFDHFCTKLNDVRVHYND